MRKGLVVIQVGKLVVEIAVLIVPHFYHTIFSPEGIAKIDAGVMVMYFYRPVGKVAPVEKRDPFALACAFSMRCAAKEPQQAGKKNALSKQEYAHRF
jgi:hypothetical protein